MSYIKAHQYLAALFYLFLSVMSASCSYVKGSGKWIKSKEGVEVFVPQNFEDVYDKSSLSCMASGYNDEGGFPTGPFNISVTTKSGKKHNILNSELPTLLPIDSLKYKYNSGDYSIFLGKFKKKKPHGYVRDYFFNSDNTLIYIEIGKFKKGKLIRGERVSFNESLRQTIVKDGIFKDDKLYMGTRYIMKNDSILKFQLGVWLPSGKLDPTFDYLYKLNQNTVLGLPADVMSEESVNFVKRYFFWLKYKWWFFIGLSIVGMCFVVYPLTNSKPEEQKEIESWERNQYRIKPWTCWGAYWRWLFFGLLRFDAYYLRQYGWCSVYSLLLWVCIVGSSKFLVLYGFEPLSWFKLLPYVYDYWQSYLFSICVGAWIVCGIWIPYNVYRINHNVFRHNIYETLILGQKRPKYDKLIKEIPIAVREDEPKIIQIREVAQDEYGKSQGLISKGFSFLTNSKVRHARNKAEILADCLDGMTDVATKHAKLLSKLTDFLEMERKNAYRNMLLAKELIFLVKSGKGNQHKLVTDHLSNLHIDAPNLEIVNPSNLPEIDFHNSVVNGFTTFDKTFTSLKELGFDDKSNLLISLGIGGLESIIDGITQINNRRTAQREHYEYFAKEAIDEILRLEDELLSIHSKMLRANEVMQALSAANEAFVKAYSPLRDYIFGKSPTFMGFMAFMFNRNKTKAKAVINDVGYLIAVCNEYNKINIGKLS